MNIEIEWLSDDHDCDACGMSWADGARIVIDGEEVIVLEPSAHCFGGAHYSNEDVYQRLLAHLGHDVSFTA